jgi:hypothetical protein
MTLALLGFLAFTAGQAPTQTAYTYRTPDGVDHYVGSEDDIPEAYRKASRKIELTGVPLNNDLAKGWKHDTAAEPPRAVPGKPTDITLTLHPTPKKEEDSDLAGPKTYAVVAAILLCLFPALLIGWLRAPRQRIPILALAIGDLVLGLGIGLYATRELRPENATDVDLNPLHALDNARKLHEQVDAAEAVRQKRMEQLDANKPPAKPSPTAPGPTPPKPPANSATKPP